MVPGAGIEPARCFAPADFESTASTNFATPARNATAGAVLLHNKFAFSFFYPYFFKMTYQTIEATIGQTPLVRLQRIQAETLKRNGSVVLGKLEGNNPAGSVKDRAAISMIRHAEQRGEIQLGDTLIEATSGNTGIALAMAAAIKGYKMVLLMPEHASAERVRTMQAYGAKVVLTPTDGGMEKARDMAQTMQDEGKGHILNQFGNTDNPRIHTETTAPEIWRETNGSITHFVSAMGTTGTITGCSRYLKEHKPSLQVIGVQPADGARIPGIRKWPAEYMPTIFDDTHIDHYHNVTQPEAENMTRQLAVEEGIFCGISAGGACHVALEIATSTPNAVVVFIVCDRGDRYLSTGVFR